MNYTDPATVRSPKTSVSDVRVLEDKQVYSFSVARLRYDDRDVLACRWNGGDAEPVGHPNSRGIPTWFLIPPEMEDDILTGVIRRAESERPPIFSELDIIKKQFTEDAITGTAVTVLHIENNLSLSDANLLVEIIRRDADLKRINVNVMDLDSQGGNTGNPISQIAGRLHIALYQG